MLIASIVIVAMLAGAILVRFWGPLNPRLTVSTSTATSQGVNDPAPRVQLSLTISNGSWATSTLQAVDLLPLPGSPSRSPVTALVVRGAHPTGPDSFQWVPVRLPVALPGSHTTLLQLTLRPPPCPGSVPTASTISLDYRVRLSYRTSAGVDRHYLSPFPTSVECLVQLPSGPQPTNPVAARLEVDQAFRQAYDAGAPEAVRDAAVVDPQSLRPFVAAAQTGQFASQATQASVAIDELSFDRPDHAWLHYTLRVPGSAFAGRLGEAFLVDGHWKVGRSGICRDLSLANIRCPT